MPLSSNPSLARKASLKMRPFSFNLHHQSACLQSRAFQLWYSMYGRSVSAVKQGVQQSKIALTAEAMAYCYKTPSVVRF